MATPTSLLELPVTPGMREDVELHAAPPGTIVFARNLRFPRPGVAQSRRGTTGLTDTVDADISFEQAFLLSPAGQDFLEPVPGGFICGAQGYGYRYDFGQSRLHVDGSYASMVPSRRRRSVSGEQNATNLSAPLAIAYSPAGYLCMLAQWGGTTATRAIIETDGGTEVWSSNDLFNAVVAETAAGPSERFVFVTASAGGSLSATVLTMNATGVASTTSAIFGSLATANHLFAACRSGGATGWYVVWQDTATQFTLALMSGSAVSSSVTFAVNSSIHFQSIYSTSTHVFVSWRDGSTQAIYYRAYDLALVLASGGTVTIATLGFSAFTPAYMTESSIGPGSVFAIYGQDSSPPNNKYTSAVLLTSAGTVTNLIGASQVWPESAPFARGYCWVSMAPLGSYVGPTGVMATGGVVYYRTALLDWSNVRVDAEFATALAPTVSLLGDASAFPGIIFLSTQFATHQYPPVQIANSNWVAALSFVARAEQEQVNQNQTLLLCELLEFSETADVGSDTAPYGNTSVISGSPCLIVSPLGTKTSVSGVLGVSPQRGGADLGFFRPPDEPTIAQSNTANGGITLLGSYQVRAVVEWVGPNGDRYRSAPSPVAIVTMTGANDTLTLTTRYGTDLLRQKAVATIGSSVSDSDVVCHFYRTTSGGQEFHRVTPPRGAPVDAGLGLYTYVDELNDLTLLAREILYTDGGVVQNDHPPSCKFLIATDDRIWCGGLWDPKQIQSSKIIVPGEPPQFSDSPTFRVPLPDDCTGLAGQDGAVVAFSDNSIYVVQGAGPNDQGQGAWDSPRLIARGIGCIDYRSIVETRMGVFFQSSRGIMLLPRGFGEPFFIGAPIQVSLATSVVTDAEVTETDETTLVRFATNTTQVFSYDMITGAWAIDAYPSTITKIAQTSSGPVMGFAVNNSATQSWAIEQSSVTTDAPAPGQGSTQQQIATSLQYSTVHPFGISGQGRFTSAVLFFDQLNAAAYPTQSCVINVQVDGTNATRTFDMAAFSGNTYRENVPTNHRGTACRVSFTTAGAPFRFIGCTLQLDNSGGARRMADAERA